MSSAVARPMRSSSKKLTSSTMSSPSFGVRNSLFLPGSSGGGRHRPPPGALHLFDAARLAPGQVDAELFRRTEHVFVGVAQLDGHAVAAQHLDVEAERLHLLDEHLEGLGDA